jgi:hypothetical protein
MTKMDRFTGRSSPTYRSTTPIDGCSRACGKEGTCVTRNAALEQAKSKP